MEFQKTESQSLRTKGAIKDFFATVIKSLFLVLSYILVSLGQPAWMPVCGPIAAALGYALFWMFLDSNVSKAKRLYFSFFWFFSVQLIQLSWLTSIKYQGLYILAVYLLLCGLMGFQFAFLTRVLFSRNSLKISTAVSVAALGILLEWSRLFIFCGFSFNFSGMALTCYLPSMQFASVFGILGLSFLFLLANALAFRAYKNSFHWKAIGCWAVVVIFPYVFGLANIRYNNGSESASSPLKVLLVQTALAPSEKFPLHRFPHEFISPYEQWRQIFSFVYPYNEKGADLVILPESVVPFGVDLPVYSLANIELVAKSLHLDLKPFYPPLEAPFAEFKNDLWLVSNAFWAQTLANFTGSEVIAGFDHHDKITKENFNAAFCFKPNAKLFDSYEKQVLLPLAEVLPWEFLKIFTKSYGITEFFTPGKHSKLFSEKWKAGVSICIEETIPEIMRDSHNKGAKLFVNVSNDGWYPNSKLTSQHYSHSRVRAVENGIPLVRACNTGVTGVVDANGSLLCSIQSESYSRSAEKGIVYKSFELRSIPTLYSFWGDAGIVTLCLVFLVWIYRPRDEGIVL